MIFTSSMAVYGEQQPPFTEDKKPQPIDPYGIAKYAVEVDLELARQQFGLRYNIIRPHNVLGVYQNIWDRYRNVIGIFIRKPLNGQPILVSVSLAIYFAERNVGPFKDTFITFSEHPSLQRIVGQTIAEKVRGLNRSGWDMNTNIQAAFDLILNTAKQYNIKADDMPTSLYIISDMQYDAASSGQTNFEVIKQKYANAGYVMPRLIFWNVNAIGKDSPVTVNDQGVCLVSGCSPSILKSVLSAKTFTPADVMLETLNKPRYDVVTV